MKKNECDISVDGRLKFNRVLPSDIETVWRFLVEDELRAKWLCGGKVDPFEGGIIEFKFDPEKLGHPSPSDVEDDKYKAEFSGEVISYEPPHKLVFSWPEADQSSMTIVKISLQTVSNGTVLNLTHENLNNPDYLIGASAGWHAHLEQLECHLSRQLSPNFWKRHEELDIEYRAKLEAMER